MKPVALIFGLLLFALPAGAQLTPADVNLILSQAVSRAVVVAPSAVVAVVDREGFVLGVWSVNGATPTTTAFTNLVGLAICKAGTAAFLSSGQNAFTTRTAAMIVQQNFPPGVNNKPPGPLVGVNFSQLPFSDINKFKGPGSVIVQSATPGNALVAVPTPISGGLVGTAGGLPLYQGGLLVGGIGVAGDGDDDPLNITPATTIAAKADEDVALAGQAGFAPGARILAAKVFIDGIALPYVASTTTFSAVPAVPAVGVVVPPYAVIASPGAVYPAATMGGVTGELRQPIQADPALTDADPANDRISGQLRLSAAEVTAILTAGANRARTTRAGIRLPRGVPMQVFISVVNNPNAAGTAPVCLGTFCTSPDTTRFSWDVAVQKARTAVFFSSDARAFTARTVGFMAQGSYPPGIVGTTPGIFLGLQERFSIITVPAIAAVNTLNGAAFTTSVAVNPNLPNGMTIFAGSMPLYRGGVLIGAVGVSGDGIDQDDLATASAAAAMGGIFLPPEPVRADRSLHRGARLPLVKFPRNPAL